MQYYNPQAAAYINTHYLTLDWVYIYSLLLWLMYVMYMTSDDADGENWQVHLGTGN
jgi:hypothetical protein